MKGTKVNDDSSLESEADVMGAKALQMKADTSQTGTLQNAPAKGNVLQGFSGWSKSIDSAPKSDTSGVLQGAFIAQLKGNPEQEAMDSVRNVQRGNVKGDILATGGESNAKLKFKRDISGGSNPLVEGIDQIETKLREALLKDGYKDTEINKIMAGGRVKAYVASVLQAGNCGEFASLIFWHIMENSDDRTVYKASMAPKTTYDHAFNIVVPDTSASTIDDVAAMQADEKVLVADGWGDKGGSPKSLKRFMKTENPYSADMKPENVSLDAKGKADKTERLSANVKKTIEKITLELYEKHKDVYLKRGKGIHDRLVKGEKVGGIFG